MVGGRIIFVFAFVLSSILAEGQMIFKDPKQPIEKRVQDLLARMTPQEKFWQLFMIPGDLDNVDREQYKNGLFGFQVSASGKGDAGGQLLNYSTNESAIALAKKINAIQKYFVEQTRLGIPIIPFDEALHGLVREGATAFPQSIALAATWDRVLMSHVANIIARETRARGIRQILSPVVNIASDVRWGRTEETYGEDPFLVSAMAVAFVKEFEKMGIITTPKHFVANVGDGGRDSYPIHINERLLEEIYFPPFRACFEKGGSRSVMTSYNSLNGVACSANSWLLQEKLKKQWGFAGFVISDANAVGGEVVLHNTAKDYPESGQHAINAGLDVIFQTEHKHHQLFDPAFYDGRIDSNRINDAVSRVLRAKFELGLFEQPYVKEDNLELYNVDPKMIARQASRESIVLLKNEKNLLPINKNIRSIAVIGPEAMITSLGGYSGPGNKKVSILDGIKEKLGMNLRLHYAVGAKKVSAPYNDVPGQYLSHDGKEGLSAEYFNNINLQGVAIVKRIDKTINNKWTLYGPDPQISANFYSARWNGQITAPATGNYKIGLEGNDGYRLYVNNKLVIDNWKKQSFHTILVDQQFEKGKKYDIRIEFFESVSNGTIRLIWNFGVENWKNEIDKAVAVARQSELVVIAAGIEEGEFRDRAMLSLPGHQEELISAVAATGKPVVVLLVGGSAVTMNNWIDKVPGILSVWYPGEEGGHAIADVLFGDYNPAGRLPITFPTHVAQLPLAYNHKPTGRGDDYNNLSGMPLFPFGYGLSYTQFEYSNSRLDQKAIATTGTATISFIVKNIGRKDGDEVVQLYIRDILSSVTRPVMELKGFQRIHLKAGEARTVSFQITPDMLSMLDIDMKRIVEPGDFSIMIGASSRDIKLVETLKVF